MIEVVNSTLDHALTIRRDLREGDVLEAVRQGVNPWTGIVKAYKNACFRRTGLIDGIPAAIWGVTGNLLGTVGSPYLITSNRISMISPIRFAKIYIKELQVMKNMFPILVNYVDAEYKEACRMLELAGFKLEPMTINDYPFYRFSMVN